jgi:hypothetical protein
MHHQNHLSRPGSRCNRNNHCIYGFPHAVQQTTTLDEAGRVQWRRRHAEDAWVVPHCPALLMFADCHFHFEIAFTAKVFSYLYKYLYKGPDVSFFTLADEADDGTHAPPRNEVNDYQKSRYLSAPESAWRILGYEITRKEPAVECLPIHLPGENTPQFRQRDGDRSSTSLLDRYFLRSLALSHLRYEEYFEQYVLYTYQPQRPSSANQPSDGQRWPGLSRSDSSPGAPSKVPNWLCLDSSPLTGQT